ncbi:TPA: hypothetical protein MFN42_005033 [Klebsiella quasipneumoniae subsp. quasipneumoniae]|nr:hypothetical protein [Klebsiella quasipneumoniae subsp. quasipneumoniae]
MFGESGFAHGDLLQEHNQYAGRSLNVNGPLYRDTYNQTIRLMIFSYNLVITFNKNRNFFIIIGC